MYVVLGQGAEEEERASVDLVAAGAGIHQHGQGEFAFPSLNSILYQNEPWVTTPRKGGRVWWTLLPATTLKYVISCSNNVLQPLWSTDRPTWKPAETRGPKEGLRVACLHGERTVEAV